MKLAFSLLLVLTATLTAGEQASDLYGTWKVVRVETAAPVTAMSGREAAHLVGRKLILGAGKLQFDGQTCQPTYDHSKETWDEILQDYKVDGKQLHVPNPVDKYDGDCTELYVQRAGKIVFYWNGFFFKATKSAPTADAKSHDQTKVK